MTQVLHITATWFDDSSVIGGGERYPTELALALSKLTPTTLLSFSDRPRSFTHEESLNVKLIKKQWGNKFSPFSTSLINEIRKADIIHTHQYHSLASNAAVFFGRLFKKKIFLSDLGGGGWNMGFYFNFNKYLTASLDISEYAKTNLQRPAKNHHVIYAGVDTNKFKPVTSPTHDYILFVGRIMPHKGVDVLIKAMPDNLKLKVVGRPYDTDYLAHCQSLAAEKNVEFIFDTNDQQLIELYQNAAVTVLPSVNTDYMGNTGDRAELFGLVLVEAMACGSAVIGSNITSIPEIISHKKIGDLFEEGNSEALKKLLDPFQNKEHILKKSQYVRQHVEDHFTWEIVAKRCLDIYER